MRMLRTLLVLGLSAVASAGVFDGLVSVVDARLADPSLSRRRSRALETARMQLASGSLVFEQARSALRGTLTIERHFRRDAAFDGAEAGVASALDAAVRADRDVVGGYAGSWGDAGRIGRGTRRADVDLARAAKARSPVAKLRALANAAGDLRQAFPPQPDFRLVDLNDKTPTSGTEISPRDQRGVISAWYFGRAG